MGVQIEEADIDTSRLIDGDSRYNNHKAFYWGPHKHLTFETYKKGRVKEIRPESDKFAVITSGFEYRPDLVSLKAYGTVGLWWQILEANNMKDIFDFKSGKNIIIPNVLI